MSDVPGDGIAPPRDAHETDAQFLRSVLSSSADCIKVLDLDANLVFMTEAGQRIMEVSDFNLIRGCPWPDFWRDQGNIDAKAAVAAAQAGGVGHFQGRASTMAGASKWWDVQVTPIFGPDGRPEKLLSVSRDITAQKVAEERQELLHQELAHRVKNTLSLVQALASQTLRGDITLEDARIAFTARLMALATANDVLMQTSWTEASLTSIVEAASRIHGTAADRFHIHGPHVRIGPRAALSFALALHELGTNAVKHGALSGPEGRVDVRWSVTTDPEPQLDFAWAEIGGPLVTRPRHRGFGSTLIDRTLAATIGAKVDIAYPATGMTLSVAGPLCAMQQV